MTTAPLYDKKQCMMENKKRNFVEWDMHYRQIIILLTCCLMAFGIYSLP